MQSAQRDQCQNCEQSGVQRPRMNIKIIKMHESVKPFNDDK